MFATSIKSEVMEAYPNLDSVGLLNKCREQFNALKEEETQKWVKKAKSAKAKYDRELDAYEAAQLDNASDDEEQSKPKKRAPKKRKQAESSDEAEDSSSDDDEPLVKKPRNGPSEAALRKVVQGIIDGGDLEEMTKKKVRKAVQAEFPDEDLEDFKVSRCQAAVTSVDKASKSTHPTSRVLLAVHTEFAVCTAFVHPALQEFLNETIIEIVTAKTA